MCVVVLTIEVVLTQLRSRRVLLLRRLTYVEGLLFCCNKMKVEQQPNAWFHEHDEPVHCFTGK